MKEKNQTKKVAKDAVVRTQNAAQVVKGKTKANVGKAVGDRGLQAQGKADVAKGKAKQVGHNVKKSLD